MLGRLRLLRVDSGGQEGGTEGLNLELNLKEVAGICNISRLPHASLKRKEEGGLEKILSGTHVALHLPCLATGTQSSRTMCEVEKDGEVRSAIRLGHTVRHCVSSTYK